MRPGWTSPLTALKFAKDIDAGAGKAPNCPITMDVSPGAQALRVDSG